MHPGKVKTLMLTILIASSVPLTLAATGTELSVVVTDSMDGQEAGYPIGGIPKGSLIAVDTTASDFRAGDVVGYRSPLIDGTVYHRVSSVDGDAVTVKGDRLGLGETVPAGDIVGKVFFVSEPMGLTVSFVRDNIVSLLVILAGAYLLLSEPRSGKKGQEREER